MLDQQAAEKVVETRSGGSGFAATVVQRFAEDTHYSIPVESSATH